MAMKSSLWELEVVLVHHYDQRVRDFAKILKTDLLARPTSLKVEEFAQADPLALLKTELNDLDMSKEIGHIRKNLLNRHGQGEKEMKDEVNILGKRLGDQLDRYDRQTLLQPDDLGYQSKRARIGEKFDQFDDFFALE